MIQRVLKFLLALVAGYAVMVVLITLVQEVMFDGVSYATTPFPQLVVAGVLTTLTAVAGGAIAALIYGKPWFPPALAMCGLVAIETPYLILANIVEGPLWFDILSASSLVVGILAGAYAVRRIRHTTITPAHAV